ncbi:polysaccharide deacetylase [Clostridium sulfidigenes]|uniref:Polysaccharide deacetylase n=1 Tax=Clostridium sulfidigenes TaxID=318464 RepID=A0A084JGV7_9CLOT|nr:delta-lactam-biosynthetic de-N-acetylase [Clostridium sulfidigenes]KEZ88191.1 polysaccharide deacetylase [Clostridium sulfidigenes]
MSKKFIRNLSLVLVIISSFMFVGCTSNTGSTSNSTTDKDENKSVFNAVKEIDDEIIKGASQNNQRNPSSSKDDLAVKPSEGDENISNDSSNSPSNEDPAPMASKIDTTNLSNEKIAWWFKPNKQHVTPEVNLKLNFDLNKYDAHYVGDTSKKVLYLTFDEGYENGYTPKILDILKANDVKAIFFVTSPYVKDNPDIIKRMVEEGHIVGNHTNHHPSMPDVTRSEEKFNNEFSDVESKFKEITGENMPLYFRPPMGEYSEKSLAMTKNLGYKTLFWSFAYHDWDINKQPDPVKAKDTIMNGLHNGAILLVHAVSKTNTEILDSVLKEAKSQGYEFQLFQ